MKNLITTISIFLYGITCFSQLCEKHNTYYYLDSVYPKQINEYKVSYDSNENPIDTTLVFKLFYGSEGNLIETQSNFYKNKYISIIYDTIYPYKKLKVNNPFPKSGISSGIYRGGKDTEIIEYNRNNQVSAHICKYKNLEHQRIFNFYDKDFKIIEQKIYWNFKLTSSTYIEYIY